MRGNGMEFLPSCQNGWNVVYFWVGSNSNEAGGVVVDLVTRCPI
jgi:hypothetical protein